MKRFLFLLLIIPIISFAKDKRKIDVESFNSESVSLFLEPDYDLLELRYDIIRQVELVSKSDPTSEIVNVENEVLGFFISDFLFVDLNKNITIQIDKLLDISLENDFSITKSCYPHRKNKQDTYRWKDKKYTIKHCDKGRERKKFSISNEVNELEVFHKKSLRFKIIKKENELLKKGKKFIYKRIYETEPHYFSTSKKKRVGDKFYLNDKNQIIVDRRYLIKINEEGDALEIYKWGRNKNNRLLYTVRYNQNEIIVYNKHSRGYQINYTPENVAIIYKGKKIIEYRREKI